MTRREPIDWIFGGLEEWVDLGLRQFEALLATYAEFERFLEGRDS